jgi:predicted RNA-binding protein with PIN domain
MSYVKILKVLLRFKFDLSEAIPKIQKIQHHKLKKY